MQCVCVCVCAEGALLSFQPLPLRLKQCMASYEACLVCLGLVVFLKPF